MNRTGRRKGDRYVANLTENSLILWHFSCFLSCFGFHLVIPTVLMNKLKSATISQKGRWGGEGETPGGNARHGLLAIGSFIPSTTVGEFLSRKVARGQ